ncbi:electron carrier, partial [Teratosphaeriaceae sp. CCFEE 6253]
MAPAVTIDNTPDFSFPSHAPTPSKPSPTQHLPTQARRTLLLAPPSIASHPQALSRVAETHDRHATDIQMLDRLALGLVTLPAATYDVVLLLTDVDRSRRESARLLDRQVMGLLVAAMKVGGRLRAQGGGFGGGAEQTEAILAGLVTADGEEGMVKPDSAAAGAQTVKLSFLGRGKKANAAAVPANGVEAAAGAAKRKSGEISQTAAVVTAKGDGNGGVVKATPAGVGFVDSNDDFDGGFDDGTGYDDEDEDMEIPDDDALE